VQLGPGSPATSPAASGTVEEQAVAAGTQVAAGSAVRLTVHSPYVARPVPPAPPAVPPPAATPVATLYDYDLAGSYQKGRLRVTVENGRYVGRSYKPNAPGTLLFDVLTTPEEFVLNGHPYTGYRGRCRDEIGRRAANEDCHVRAGYFPLPPHSLEIAFFVVRNGVTVEIGFRYGHDTYVSPHATKGTVPR
jgi:hypothetical protein